LAITFGFSTFRSNRKALATAYASLLAIILIMALLAVVISLYVSYNKSILGQMELTQQKAQERLTIKYASRTDSNLDVFLSNMGNEELKVRAIYLKNETTSTFVGAPDEIIQPYRTEKVTVTIPQGMADFSIMASTELGTLSKEYFLPISEQDLLVYDTENIVLGSLKLRFNSFEYSLYQNNQWGQWVFGWAPPLGVYIQWRVEIVNVSNQTIKLSNLSSLTLSDCNGPTEKSWYIINSPITLTANSTTSILYRVGTAGGDATKSAEFVKILSPGNQMVFLTFFGTRQSASGEVPFGQTIPFLSVISGGS